MKHDANISSNAAAEQVHFIMHFVLILHVRSQKYFVVFNLEILLIIVG